MKEKIELVKELLQEIVDNCECLEEHGYNCFMNANVLLDELLGKEQHILCTEEKTIDWEQRRYEIAKTALGGILSNSVLLNEIEEEMKDSDETKTYWAAMDACIAAERLIIQLRISEGSWRTDMLYNEQTIKENNKNEDIKRRGIIEKLKEENK